MKNSNKTKRYKFHIIICIFIIILCIGFTPKKLQNDTFYTIKVGEYISNNGIFNLREDPFSWQNLPYTFPHWLYDLIMYTIYSIGGWLGIYLSTMVLYSVLGICIYFTSNKISKNAPISAVVTIIAIILMTPYVAARAQLITFSLMVLTVYLIEKFLENAKKRYAIGLILLSLLIVNLHMAVWPFFFVIFVPYIVEYIISLDIINVDLLLKLKMWILKKINNKKYEDKIMDLYIKLEDNKKKREEIKKNPYKIKITRNDNVKKLFLVMIICAFMGIFTPTGLTTPYTYLYKTITGNTMQVINEHKPINFSANKGFLIYFIVYIVVLTFIDIKIDLKHLLYYLGILYLAIKSRRQVSMFLIICTPILAKLLADIAKKYMPKLEEYIIKIVTNFYGYIILGTIVIITTIQNIKPIMKSQYYANENYPIYASEWIKNNLNLETTKLFNEYNYGSYLLYEGIPVLIDSRCDLYTPQFNSPTGKAKDGKDIFMDVQNVTTGAADYSKVFKEYGITHVITYSDSKIHNKLDQDSNYEKIYPKTEEEKQKDNRFVIYKKIN